MLRRPASTHKPGGVTKPGKENTECQETFYDSCDMGPMKLW
ncbi:hypothetical protein QEH46_gp33 [Rothia phage Spartoi]|uniref:Uncharacterized protein n=1 Tax=Rothia phage Spartoi TaxID=2483661 RepID=A0A5K7NI15_9CAUD|nr:hypothetical protein QEH46_gp33 [Rothia phage Spartoi]AZF88217.1 hypothetical protein SEA_SPARTOI_33 [Rothia phage Spartoi]